MSYAKHSLTDNKKDKIIIKYIKNIQLYGLDFHKFLFEFFIINN
jgi:hypothetical protein